MKTIIRDMHIDTYASKLFDMYFKEKNIAVFDIETTGLSPRRCKVILSGILLINGQNCRAIQLFADQENDEEEIIRQTFHLLDSVDMMLTYNGRHFDLPFMEARAKRYGINGFRFPYNLDLYLVVNGHSALRQTLPSLKQKSLEIFMGLSDSRDDEISGGESVELYHRYMLSHSFDLEKKILLHNHDDLLQLYKLLPIIEKTDFQSGRELQVSGLQNHPTDYISFPTEERPYTLVMSRSDASAKLTIPCESEAGALYIDARSILGENFTPIEKYPSVFNGYLILSEKDKIHHLDQILLYRGKNFSRDVFHRLISAGKRGDVTNCHINHTLSQLQNSPLPTNAFYVIGFHKDRSLFETAKGHGNILFVSIDSRIPAAKHSPHSAENNEQQRRYPKLSAVFFICDKQSGNKQSKSEKETETQKKIRKCALCRPGVFRYFLHLRQYLFHRLPQTFFFDQRKQNRILAALLIRSSAVTYSVKLKCSCFQPLHQEGLMIGKAADLFFLYSIPFFRQKPVFDL